MHHLVNNIVKPLALMAVAVLVAHCHVGCASSVIGSSDVEQAYTNALTRCVEVSHTRQESCICRKAVDVAYGVCDNHDWPKVGRCGYDC